MSETHAFEFHADKAPAFRVVSFTSDEQLHDVYRVEVLLTCAADDDKLADLEGALLGANAALTVMSGSHKRRLHGVVSSVRVASLDDKLARVHVEIVPRLALMKLRRQNRIFQDQSVKDVLHALCGEWRVPCRFSLGGEHKARPYLTQHGESDFDFLRRIAALEGIGFYFPASTPDAALHDHTDVVFFDQGDYPPIPSGEGDQRAARVKGAPVLRHAHKNFEHGADDLLDFDMRRALGVRAALLSDFDFRRPQFGMRAHSHADRSEAIAPSAAERNELFDATYYHDRIEYEGSASGAEIDDDLAQTAFEQLRSEIRVGSGFTRSVRPVPGHVFLLEGHPIEAMNDVYLVTRVEQTGKIPEASAEDAQTFDARVTVVPGAVVHRPPIERGHHLVRGAETATVVGPDGEDVYTDDSGRVKVRFHWDTQSKGDDKSSCWLRVAQSWSGSRWGSQFVPRVGMEVLVTYLGGDVDRPLVTACLYNATHPPPFRLPADRHRSGLRTVSSDGGGHNELSFQDRAGEEQVFLQAHRDLDFEVGRDHTAFVERDETRRVGGSQTISIEGSRTERLNGPSTLAIGGDRTQTIKGDHNVSVTGDRTDQVAGNHEQRVGGDLITRVDGDFRPELNGSATVAMAGDAVVKALGHLVAVVGQNDAKKSSTIHVQGTSELYATGTSELTSEKAITIRVGTSSIRVTADGIEIGADTITLRGKDIYHLADEKMKLVAKKEALFKSDKKIFLQAEAGSLQLTRDARVDGDMVKLNCSPDPVDDTVPDAEDIKVTKFSLVDDKGKPMANQRIVLVMSDGSERTAVLDEDGKAELELDDSGDVVLPDVAKPQPA